jgi:NAD(P)-dependent dehydrogenase (short-subunit alcohol dehydrogenase family)
MRLKDRVAIVTGGSSGIGRGIALEFAKEGAKVVVADVQEKPKKGRFYDQDLVTTTAEEVEKLGSDGLFVQTDMLDEQAVKHLIDRAVEHFGGLDILVNNAGIHVPGGILALSIEDYDRVIGVNLRGLFVATKFAMPHLKKNTGRVIHIASVQAFGGGGGPAYASAKAGIINFTRDTALELAPFGATVNAICPGYIETPMQDYASEEDIDAEWVTGTSLPVDGGWLAPIF